MAQIAIRTGSRLGLRILIALMLVAVLAVPAMAHEGKVDLGIQATTITSATRITLGRVVVKGTVTCSKTTSGVGVYAGVRQVAGAPTPSPAIAAVSSAASPGPRSPSP